MLSDRIPYTVDTKQLKVTNVCGVLLKKGLYEEVMYILLMSFKKRKAPA